MMYYSDEGAQTAFLSGLPVELIRVRMFAADGDIWSAIRHGGDDQAPWAVSVRQVCDHYAKELRAHRRVDGILFEIPIIATQAADGGLIWSTSVEVPSEVLVRDKGSVMSTAAKLEADAKAIVERNIQTVTFR